MFSLIVSWYCYLHGVWLLAIKKLYSGVTSKTELKLNFYHVLKCTTKQNLDGYWDSFIVFKLKKDGPVLCFKIGSVKILNSVKKENEQLCFYNI